MGRWIVLVALGLGMTGCLPWWGASLIRDFVIWPVIVGAVNADRAAHGSDLTPLNAGSSAPSQGPPDTPAQEGHPQ